MQWMVFPRSQQYLNLVCPKYQKNINKASQKENLREVSDRNPPLYIEKQQNTLIIVCI